MTNNLNSIIHHLKKFKFKSVFFKQFFSILLVIAVPMVFVTAMVIYHYEKTAYDNSQYEMQMGFEKVTERIDGFTQAIDNGAYAILADTDVQFFTVDNNVNIDNSVLYTRTNQIKKNLNMYVLSNGSIDSAYIYSRKNNVVIGNQASNTLESFPDTGWYEAYNVSGENKLQ